LTITHSFFIRYGFAVEDNPGNTAEIRFWKTDGFRSDKEQASFASKEPSTTLRHDAELRSSDPFEVVIPQDLQRLGQGWRRLVRTTCIVPGIKRIEVCIKRFQQGSERILSMFPTTEEEDEAVLARSQGSNAQLNEIQRSVGHALL